MKRRRLPHIYREGAWLFVTWHLHGCLPQGPYPPPDNASAGKAFVWLDRYLDTVREGPMYLKRPEIANLVVGVLRRGASEGIYRLGPYAVMANHVHVLLLPGADVGRALQWVKGVTAREANLKLGLTGKPFWQRESYDRWVRSDEEWLRIAGYIENNPVKAGLVGEASEYLWSSAAMGERELKFAPAR